MLLRLNDPPDVDALLALLAPERLLVDPDADAALLAEDGSALTSSMSSVRSERSMREARPVSVTPSGLRIFLIQVSSRSRFAAISNRFRHLDSSGQIEAVYRGR